MLWHTPKWLVAQLSPWQWPLTPLTLQQWPPPPSLLVCWPLAWPYVWNGAGFSCTAQTSAFLAPLATTTDSQLIRPPVRQLKAKVYSSVIETCHQYSFGNALQNGVFYEFLTSSTLILPLIPTPPGFTVWLLRSFVWVFNVQSATKMHFLNFCFFLIFY